jgi:hypothetical protein
LNYWNGIIVINTALLSFIARTNKNTTNALVIKFMDLADAQSFRLDPANILSAKFLTFQAKELAKNYRGAFIGIF